MAIIAGGGRDGTGQDAAHELAALRRSLAEARQALRDAEERARCLRESIGNGFFLLDSAGRIIEANRAAEQLLAPLGGAPLVGSSFRERFVDPEGAPVASACRNAIAENAPVEVELRHAPLARWFRLRAVPSGADLAIFLLDITPRKEAQVMLEAEKTLLALMASGAGLTEVLHAITHQVEALSMHGMLTSILLLDEDGKHLLHGAAPSLPAEYNQAIHGLAIGPGVGSCGSAAYERASVVAADIATDPRWTAFKDLAARHGLASCTSLPIISAQGEMLGTLAMYYRKRGEPSASDLRLTEFARDMAVIAISRQRSDEALQRSEQQLRLIANSIPQLAWMVEPDGSVSWYNERWYEYTGTTLERMQAPDKGNVLDPALAEEVRARWYGSIQSGEPFEMEFPLRAADGSFRWFLTRMSPLRDAQGRVTRWFGTNTDIDDVRRIRQAYEEETRMLEVLNQSGMDLASGLDLHELLQKVTDSATKLTGAKFGAFFYNTVDDNGEAFLLYTLSGAPREAFEKLGKPRATPVFAPTFKGEGIVRSDDITKDPRYGHWGPHKGMPKGHLPVRSYLAVPVQSRSGEVVGGLFFGHERVGVFGERAERLVAGIAAQAAVAIDNARLYEAAHRAARDRETLLESERHARSEAERASRMKDEFLATLSHELRTPLGAILGWTHLLLQNASPRPEDLRKGLETIERNARLQTHLIEDLLDMSRIISGKLKLDLQSVTPAAFVDAAIETVRPAAAAKQIRIVAEIDRDAGPVTGDSTRLQQTVWNLLNNAVKFTPQGGTVRVTVARADDAVEIAVADNGVGIERPFLDHVFERFRQADASTTRRFGGLGLGLAIVKQLVEMHGGRVRVDSPGKNLGSTFTVRLPLGDASPVRQALPDRAAEVAAPPDAPRGHDLAGLHVLIVDDHADAVDLMSRVLTDAGARVSTASCALTALAAIDRERPDLLVSDIGMPEMDGYELLRRVRNLDESRGGKVPAIATTAFVRPEDKARALESGFALHLAKPLQPGELVAAVARVAGRRH